VAGINSLNQLKHKVTGDKRFPFDVVAVGLPRGASGGVTPARSANWADLDGIDLLYIPGGPTANDTQISDIDADAQLNRAVDGKGAKAKRIYEEHVSRAAYELKLIGVARNRGIPVLAVCAGSWRLLESYGGAVRTLEVTQRDKHKAKDTKETWALRHQLTLLASKTLIKTSRRDAEHDQLVDKVNSTHWAVADADAMPRRLRTGSLGARNMLVPSNMLDISAIDPDTQTVEAFESLYGAPTMGIQWHPESYLPGMLGADQPGDEAAQHISRSLFEFMVYAAETSAKRAVVINTFNTEARVFAALEDCIRQVAAKQTVGVSTRYSAAVEILPKDLWSFRVRRLDALLAVLGEYVRADAAGKAAQAAEHYREAKAELAEYGIVI
jgi:gamma-glutamyl-gamma-aminobutyrate hydrolase PuuD